MAKAINKGKTDKYVYDISLDGTVVNALGRNIVSNTDGFNFKLPESDKFRYTKNNPYIGKGLNRNVDEGKEYIGFEADVAEFNDIFMRGKMGLGIDEVVDATINFSRKNYSDYFPENPYPEDVKKVGNTVKSKKMPDYIAKFLDKGIRLLLQKNGNGFLEEYYSYIEKIYNYQIPIRDIASKGKVKKTLEEYVADCKTVTKAGQPKSRQAWMELALNANLKVDMGNVLYYYNIGTSKSHADVKKVVHYIDIVTDLTGKHEVDITKELESAWRKEAKQYKNKIKGKELKEIRNTWMAKNYPKVKIEDEIVLNSVLLDNSVIDADHDIFCEEGKEYNVPKYIEQFNKRITPLLVCFSTDIRDKILITNPKDRPYFTEVETELCNGQPYKVTDQDTYEQLMTMEDKEIIFWEAHPEFDIPFIKECGMNWNNILNDYKDRIRKEKELGIDLTRIEYEKCINEMSKEELSEFMEDGKMPTKLEKIIDVDPITGHFISKEYPDVVIGTVNDFIYRNNAEEIDVNDSDIE